jgi:Putative DNA-binding domain
MPSLHELQSAMRQSLVHRDQAAACVMLAPHVPPERLDIYRNTFLLTLTKALRLCFPAVHKLVGGAFFEGAVQIFIAEHPPSSAWLDQYGGSFPEFLREVGLAASVPYLSGVAQLEWAVHSALHASETAPLDPAELTALAPEDQSRVCLIAEPSLALISMTYPVDAIWRAVLMEVGEDLGKIDLASGPVHLIIERREGGAEVERLDGPAWQFLARLCAGRPLAAVIGDAQGGSSFDCTSALAAHLAEGRFCRFELAPEAGSAIAGVLA